MDLDILRRRFLHLVIPLMWSIAAGAGIFASINGQGLFSHYSLLAFVFVGLATVAIVIWQTGVPARILSSIGFMGAIGALYMVLQESPLRADAYLCFIAALPILAGWCDKRATAAAIGVFLLFVLNIARVDLGLLVGEGGSGFRIAAQLTIAFVALHGASWIVANLETASGRVETALGEAMSARKETERMAAEQLRFAEDSRLERRRKMQEVAHVFRDRVDSIIERVAGGARQVAETAETLTAIVDETTKVTEETVQRSAIATRNATIAAAATEQVSASASEVAHGISTTTAAVKVTTGHALENARIMGSLAAAAENIGGVSNMIRSIAEQTNLLALNATLEAARVGPAGRGFAVVASQVKSLADQTEAATRSIDDQISAIQDAARAARDGSADISEAMREAEARSLDISTAVAQQREATAEICQSVQASATESSEIEHAIGAVGEAITRTSLVAQDMRSASDELSSETDHLRQEVDTLLKELAA